MKKTNKACDTRTIFSIPEETTGLAINSVPSKGDETEALVTCTHIALKSNFSCCTNNMQSCRLSVNHPGLQKEFNLSHFHTLTLWKTLFSHVANSGTQPTSNACSLYKSTGSCWDGVCRLCCTRLPVLFSHWCIQVWRGMCARELAG